MKNPSRRRFFRRSLITAALCAAVVSACSQTEGQGGGPGGGFAPPPMPVETAAVSQEPVIERFRAVGTIEAGEAITVVSEIDALVTKLPFREGGRVARGAVLAQLDDSQLRAQEARANALLEQSQINYDRTKSIVDKGAAARQELDNADALLKVAQADLDVTRAQRSKARITAPFAGIVGARMVSPGAYVRAGEIITQLAQVNRIKVTFSVPERYLGQLHRGAEVAVSTTAYPGHVLKGTIDVIEPVLDPTTRNARILARADNPEGLFRPGMSADISVVLAERNEAITIPSEAVFVEGAQAFVYAVSPDSMVAKTAVQLGTRMADVVEVVDGLGPGMTVVRAGHQKLFPGAKVMPIQSQPGGGSQPGAPGGDGQPGAPESDADQAQAPAGDGE